MVSKADLVFFLIGLSREADKVYFCWEDVWSTNAVHVQVVEARVSPNLAWRRTGKTFWEKTRLWLERCNRDYKLSQVKQAGGSIGDTSVEEGRFHRMVRGDFFLFSPQELLLRKWCYSQLYSMKHHLLQEHVTVENYLLCGFSGHLAFELWIHLIFEKDRNKMHDYGGKWSCTHSKSFTFHLNPMRKLWH